MPKNEKQPAATRRLFWRRVMRALGIPVLFASLLFVVEKSKPGKGMADTSIPDIEMVEIPAGEFLMGANDGPSLERPRHRVRVDRFFLGKTEVTVGQWRMFVRDKGYVSQAERSGRGQVRIAGERRGSYQKDATWKNPYLPQTDSHPVVLVSWNDARIFCNWLSRKTGLRYRLPSEAEWEYACRAGVAGETVDDLDAVAWYEDNSGGSPHPVAGKHPNAFGLHDMQGNVWEWCQDYYGEDYYRMSPVFNPTGPATGSQRVSRGGSWCSKAPRTRKTFRRHDNPDFCFYRLGFRLARSSQKG